MKTNASAKMKPGKVLKKAAWLLIPLALNGSLVFGSQDIQPIWGRQIGTSSDDGGVDVATDVDGNCWVIGKTSGNLGGTNFGDSDMVVAKYNPSGKQLWLVQQGSSGADRPNGMVVDSEGNGYITGQVQGTLANSGFGSDDVIVWKIAPNGRTVWMTQYGGPSSDCGNAIACDASGNIFVAGSTGGTLGTNRFGGKDAFLSKLNRDGTLLWTRQWGSTVNDIAHALQSDSAGNLYVAGDTTGKLGTNCFGKEDIFLTKIAGDGTVLWSQQYGTSSPELGFAVWVDDQNNVYLGGSTGGSIGSAQIGQGDAVLLKVDSTGALLWQRQFGTPKWDGIHGIAMSTNGPRAIVVGGCGRYPNCLAFVRAFDPAGNELWKQDLAPAESTCGRKVAVDAMGGVYQTGGTAAKVFRTNQGGPSDLFLVKYSMTVTPPVREPKCADGVARPAATGGKCSTARIEKSEDLSSGDRYTTTTNIPGNACCDVTTSGSTNRTSHAVKQ